MNPSSSTSTQYSFCTIIDTIQHLFTSTTILITLEDIPILCTMISVNDNICQASSIPLSQISIKTKKCQSNAGDRLDLIQTAPVPSIGLARQHKNKQNAKIENPTYFTDVTLAEVDELTKKLVDISHPDDKWITDELIKTKKVSACCQGHTGKRATPIGDGCGCP